MVVHPPKSPRSLQPTRQTNQESNPVHLPRPDPKQTSHHHATATTNELEGAINAANTTTLNDLAGEPVSEFHPAQWSALIDHAIIGANQIRFIFRAGKGITVGL